MYLGKIISELCRKRQSTHLSVVAGTNILLLMCQFIILMFNYITGSLEFDSKLLQLAWSWPIRLCSKLKGPGPGIEMMRINLRLVVARMFPRCSDNWSSCLCSGPPMLV